MIYLFYGEETYLLDKKVKEITSEVEFPEMNLTYYTDESDLNDMSQVISLAPFLSEKRAIVFRTGTLKGNDELRKILSEVSDMVDVVIATECVDKRSAIYKEFKTCAVECKKPEMEKVAEFIALIAKKEGRKTEYAAAIELIRRLNYYEEKDVNLYAIRGMVGQIVVTSDITMSAVTSMLPESAAGKAYALASLLCECKKEELFARVQYLMDSGESEIGLLAILMRVFRLAWKANIGLKTNTPIFQYQSALCFSTEQQSKVLDIFADAMSRIKEGGIADVVFSVALVKALQVLHNKAS